VSERMMRRAEGAGSILSGNGGASASGWVPVDVLGRMVRIRYAGLASEAVFDVPDGVGIRRMVMGIGMSPLADLVWAALPAARRGLADQLNDQLDDAAYYDRRLITPSPYSAAKAVRSALERAVAGLPATAPEVARCAAVVRQVVELDRALGRMYLYVLQSEFVEQLDDGVLQRLRAVDADAAAELDALVSGVAVEPPPYDPTAPFRPLAPDGAIGRGWLEVEVRPEARVVRTRYGGVLSTAVFRVGPVDLERPESDIYLGPYPEALWEAVPDARPMLRELVGRELDTATLEERTPDALPPDQVCVEFLRQVIEPAFAVMAEDRMSFEECCVVVGELIAVATELGGPHLTALRERVCRPLAREPFRSAIATTAPDRLADIERFLARTQQTE
jgi:hypothetical protein